jgi:hypothetical protein
VLHPGGCADFAFLYDGGMTSTPLNPMIDPRQGRVFLIALASLFTVFTGFMGFILARLPDTPFTVGFMGVCFGITALLWMGGLKTAWRQPTLRVLAAVLAVLLGVNLGHHLWLLTLPPVHGHTHFLSWSAVAGFLLFGVPACLFAGWGHLIGPGGLKPEREWRGWEQAVFVVENLCLVAGMGILLAQLGAYVLHWVH